MRIFAPVGVITALLFVSFDALAEEADGPSHRGLFTRLTIGVGGAKAVNDGAAEIALGGPAGFFSFDIGGSLAERLALHVRLAGHNMVNPTLSVDGDERGETDDTSVSFSMLGLGLTYYFPSNFYLTGVVGFSGATVEVAGDEFESDTGFALAGDVGYEWWLGGDWGLGVAGRLEFHSIPADPNRLIDTAAAILFSVTYH
jgi:hypothetical protein